jgi:RNA polymerase sigma-70 factor (ECF subfamily)
VTDFTDDGLVARCRGQHDPAAFAELVHRYQHRVFRLVVSILGQEFAPDAEDVAQEVFVRVHHGLNSWRGDAAFSTWLYRITFNHALNVKARMRFRAPHVPADVLSSRASDALPADQQMDAHRRNLVVLACVRDLPEVYQAALRLHYWLGASMSEIADMLDTPENTVKSYLHRARKLLHGMLQQRGIHER